MIPAMIFALMSPFGTYGIGCGSTTFNEPEPTGWAAWFRYGHELV